MAERTDAEAGPRLTDILLEADLAVFAASFSDDATIGSLIRLLSEGRPVLISHLRSLGLPLGASQRLTNALSKASREGRVSRVEPHRQRLATCQWCGAKTCAIARRHVDAADAPAPASATPLSEKPTEGHASVLRLFSLDSHVSVIADVRDILSKLFGGAVAVTEWNISKSHSWVFGREPEQDVRHVNWETWRDICPATIAAFQREYGEMLQAYDGFIVTHTPVFALLFEPFGKPIVVVNSCRYDQPYCSTGADSDFRHLNERLCAMHASGQMRLLNNNRADAEYLRRGNGIVAPVVPSICAYTGAKYTGRRPEWVLLGFGTVPASAAGLVVHAWPTLGKRYAWSDLYDFAGVVLTPYECSTMTLFELYTANVPLLIPTASCVTRELGGLKSVFSYGNGRTYPRWAIEFCSNVTVTRQLYAGYTWRKNSYTASLQCSSSP
jgi:hypothetical protein